MRIIPLSEGAFSIDKSKIFIPFTVGVDNLLDRPKGSLLVEIQPFCVITREDILVLDCGLGYVEKDGVLQIHRNLMNAGINPMEVTKVLMSHLHKDHAGGVAKKDVNSGMRFLSFPNATYYVNAQELDFAMSGDSKSHQPEDVELLVDSPQVELLGDMGFIDNYIRFEKTGGHCRYHQAFWIEEEGQTVFFGGDEAPQLGQMRKKYVAKYDEDGERAMQLRDQWWEEGQREDWTFLFYHDIKHAVYKAQ